MATANESDNQITGDECSICLVPLSQQGLDIYTTACHHQFHFQCLAKNVQAQNNECPLCRTRLDSLVNILNVSATTATPVPTENVPVQQATPTPVQVIQTQQAAPVQVMQTQQVAPTQTASSNYRTSLWDTLTSPFRNAFGWSNSASNTAGPSIIRKKKTSRWSVSYTCKKKRTHHVVFSFSSR